MPRAHESKDTLVAVTFTLKVEGNVNQIAVGVNGNELDFGTGDSVELKLEPGIHALSWDSFGSYPAKFTITHSKASPQSTQRSYFPSDRRLDGVRDIEVI